MFDGGRYPVPDSYYQRMSYNLYIFSRCIRYMVVNPYLNQMLHCNVLTFDLLQQTGQQLNCQAY